MAEMKTKYQAPALAKGLEILELLAERGEPMSMVDVAKALDRSKNELYRMLVELEQRGYVERSERSDDYKLTNKMFTVAMRRPPIRNMVAVSLPHMQRLSADLDQSCHIAVINEESIVVLNRIEAPGELGFAVRLGYRRRIDHSTSGAVIMAFSSDYEQTRLTSLLTKTVTGFDAEKFKKRLLGIKNSGFLEEASAIVKGVVDIGVPIFDHTGSSCAALTIPFIERGDARTRKAEAIEKLKATGAEISSELAAGSP